MRDSVGVGTVYMYPEICSVHDMDNCKRSGRSRVVPEVPRHLHFWMASRDKTKQPSVYSIDTTFSSLDPPLQFLHY